MRRAPGKRAEKVDPYRKPGQMLSKEAPDLSQIDLRMKWKRCRAGIHIASDTSSRFGPA